ncbi:MAG: HAMP domain-containing histidine kinase [Gammaproteobacteria bacterium]|nr:HAMP domain-containing histidine kinase [Gammaproteobacteria bacterium]
MTSVWTMARHPGRIASARAAAGYQNMLQLIQLRWIAVFGQVVTILVVWKGFDIRLPLPQMFAVIGGLVLLNLFSLFRPRRNNEVRNADLMAGLLVDVAALTTLLYFSGGATNPFVFLYPLQVTLGATLLAAWSTWMLVSLTTLCFVGLMYFHVPLAITPERLAQLHPIGMLIGFVLDVALIVVFMTRINANLRRRDAALADLRQRAAEEDHIVRMGLLASGAAHELGTPLATLSVILGDWKRMPPCRDCPDMMQELGDMEAEVRRCKSIVSGILLSAGEARGESPVLTTLPAFLDELVAEWRGRRPAAKLDYDCEGIGPDCASTPIVSDSALKQVIGNVLDNAHEASPQGLRFSADCHEGQITLTVRDRGPGFAPDMLAQFGRPYQSSKGRPGGGLGLFLVVNVLRKLGGTASAENAPGGGAVVRLQLPLSSLSLDEGDD